MKSIRAIVSEYLYNQSYPVQQAITDADIDQWLSQNAPELIDKFSDELTQSLDCKQIELVQSIHSELAGFQLRLFESWRAPLTRLDSLIAMCMEVGNEITAEYRSSKQHPLSSRGNITTRLHIRAVQIANEIACLLKGGYPDAAMARWRSLHETVVTLAFLCQHDEALSSRFLDFQVFTRLKAAKEYNEHHAVLGFKSFDKEKLEKLTKESESMKLKYGKNADKENGWASDVLGKRRVTFKEIEKFVEMDYLRPHYGFASKNVHSGIDSLGYKLALSMSSQEILLAGPSNEGLLEPMQCTSHSLIIATNVLIETFPNYERSIFKGVLRKWHEKLESELVEAEAKLRRSGISGQ